MNGLFEINASSSFLTMGMILLLTEKIKDPIVLITDEEFCTKVLVMFYIAKRKVAPYKISSIGFLNLKQLLFMEKKPVGGVYSCT